MMIQTEKRSDRWELTLVPPEGKPPTLDHPLLSELERIVTEWHALLDSGAEDSPRLIVLQSAAPKYFCVGANIAALRTLDADTMSDWNAHGHAVVNLLEDLPVPVVAKVRGYAVGGGLELAMACDLIACDESAKLGLTESNIGFVPGWGGSLRLPRRVGVATAKRLFYTGEVLGAKEAAEIGLVDFVKGAAELDGWIDWFAAQIKQRSEVSIRGFKRIVNDAEKEARRQNELAETEHSQACISSEDTKRRVHEFLYGKK